MVSPLVGKVQHPAKFSDELIPQLYAVLKGTKNVLDPMAGVGKITHIRELGYNGLIYCNELEPEWAEQIEGAYKITTCDARNLPYPDNFFDAICTSPPYSNRLADDFEAKDGSKRITYRHFLGRKLSKGSTANLQWGEKYRQGQKEIWKECIRVLKPNGLFILNISDHIRRGQVVPVSEWHKQTLVDMGLEYHNTTTIETKRMRFGANSHLRVGHENIFVFRKPEFN